jgi:hypothetical protein
LTHEAHMHVTAAEAFSAATGITYYNVHVAPKQREREKERERGRKRERKREREGERERERETSGADCRMESKQALQSSMLAIVRSCPIASFV